ncbi:MAG TPA: SprT family zinc-dependent metalloprotease [Gammaproteobacteria bacterium]|jgi:hypothetical protein|nr:SprT family zinc-dependent metalloprotease [Gammaproteobacteria bacterium]
MTLLNTELTWPPTYQVKRHRLAKRVKLRASKRDGLVITIPYRFSLRSLPAVLEDNKAWILKQLAKIPVTTEDLLPTTLALTAMNQVWTIQYIFCQSRLELFQRPTGEIVIVGNTTEKQHCKQLLLQWIKLQAKKYLSTLLEQCSRKTGLNYSSILIRDQQTRWGSCSSDKRINLNYRLIFFPVELATHVIIHELCHTKHLNHSPKFWRLVASHDPAWQQHKRVLRQASQYVPSWLD